MATGSEIVQAERVAGSTPVPKFPGGFITIWPSQRHGNDWIWPSMANFVGNGFDESERLDMATRTANDKPGAFVVRIPADGEKAGAMPECVRCLVRDADDAFKIMHAADMTATSPRLKASIDAVKAHYAGGGQ